MAVAPMHDSPRACSPVYVTARSPRGIWTTRAECAKEIERGEADLLLWGPITRPTVSGRGRGPIVRFVLAGHAAVGKRCLRGGVLGNLLGDRYLGGRRAFRQLEVAARLRDVGVPTPAILAAGTRRVAWWFHVQAIVTRELAGGQDLLEIAGESLSLSRRRRVLLQCADLVRAMHEAGFLHADLNVTNLVFEHGPEGETLHVLDLDRGRFVDCPSTADRVRNLARLLRSYEKWIAERLRLSRREEILFVRRYCAGNRTLMRRLVGRLRRYRAGLALRRIVWRLSAARRSGRAPRRPME